MIGPYDEECLRSFTVRVRTRTTASKLLLPLSRSNAYSSPSFRGRVHPLRVDQVRVRVGFHERRVRLQFLRRVRRCGATTRGRGYVEGGSPRLVSGRSYPSRCDDVYVNVWLIFAQNDTCRHQIARDAPFPSNPRAVTPFVASPSSNSFNAYSTSIDGGALGSFTHEYTKHSGSSGLLKSGCSARPSRPVFSGRSFQRSSRSRANGDRSEERYRSSPRAVTQNAPSAFACRRDLSAARVD